MRQVIGVDDRVVHGVRRVDVDPTVAERVLESGANADGARNIVPNQDFHQANGTGEDVVRRRVVDRLVARYDTRVRAHSGGKLVDFAQDVGL